MQDIMPFPLLGLDTDNDTVFINETIKSWCAAGGVAKVVGIPVRRPPGS